MSKLYCLFKNQKGLVCLLYSWLILVIFIFYGMGIMSSDFVRFGPSANTYLLSMRIDTWPKWSMVCFYVFMNTAINSFVDESMGPWIQNTVQDHKNKFIPYTKSTCIWICQTYYFYGNVMAMFGLFAMFSQLDFLVIKSLCDIGITYYTTKQFLRHKVFDKEQYDRWFEDDNEVKNQDKFYYSV